MVVMAVMVVVMDKNGAVAIVAMAVVCHFRWHCCYFVIVVVVVIVMVAMAVVCHFRCGSSLALSLGLLFVFILSLL